MTANTPKKRAIRNRMSRNTWSKMMSAVGIVQIKIQGKGGGTGRYRTPSTTTTTTSCSCCYSLFLFVFPLHSSTFVTNTINSLDQFVMSLGRCSSFEGNVSVLLLSSLFLLLVPLGFGFPFNFPPYKSPPPTLALHWSFTSSSSYPPPNCRPS